jgi:hypothetical protein
VLGIKALAVGGVPALRTEVRSSQRRPRAKDGKALYIALVGSGLAKPPALRLLLAFVNDELLSCGDFTERENQWTSAASEKIRITTRKT